LVCSVSIDSLLRVVSIVSHTLFLQQIDTVVTDQQTYDLQPSWSCPDDIIFKDSLLELFLFMFTQRILTTIVLLSLSCITFSGSLLAAGGKINAGARGGALPSAQDSAELDFNEATHLVFMREEEKLARDVYTKLGIHYPDSVVFGNIDDSEQRHTDAVKGMLARYGVEDPNTNDNLGVFTGEEYGDYFTDKYEYLINKGSNSELDALYVGAFIEELDMRDINRCPQVIIEQDNGVDDDSQCGLLYTDQPDVINLYQSLLNGSKSHLRGYVRAIEAIVGKGTYTAQVLSQEEVDAILGR
jgi:hypothetical protein